ncbi:MAG: protein kinase [Candidatus Obscuribacterales bacterium]|nr:protein kinase [Candidatus Obscuribacterales bacterium]
MDQQHDALQPQIRVTIDESFQPPIEPVDVAVNAARQREIDHSMMLAEKRLGAHFEFLSVLGSGGTGCVFKVRDNRTKRLAAVKLLNTELNNDNTVLKRFKNEATSLSELDHENIVSVYDHGITHDGIPILVMEMVEGKTLQETLKSGGKLEPQLAVELSKQVCRAMAYAHEHRWVHRDLKPSNIIVSNIASGAPHVKVLDFGIAKMLESSDSTDLTQTTDIIGTPLYMSPEQFENSGLDQRSDIYSFGCILYEMLTGQVPFPGTNPVQIALKHINGKPAPFAENCADGDMLVSLEQVVERCLRKSKESRYQNFSAVLADLESIAKGSVVSYQDGAGQTPGSVLDKTKKGIGKIWTFSCYVFKISYFLMVAQMVLVPWTSAGMPSFVDTMVKGWVGGLALLGFVGLLKPSINLMKTFKTRRTMDKWTIEFTQLSVAKLYLVIAFAFLLRLPEPFLSVAAFALCGSMLGTTAIVAGSIVWSGIVDTKRLVDLNKKILARFRKRDLEGATMSDASTPIGWSTAIRRLLPVSAVVAGVLLVMPPLSSGTFEKMGVVSNNLNADLSGVFLNASWTLDHGNLCSAELYATYLLRKGETKRATEILKQTRIENADEGYVVGIAKMERQLGLNSQSLASLDHLIKKDDGAAWLRLTRAQTLLSLGRYDEAFPELDELVKSKGYNLSEHRSCRGLSYIGLKNYHKAIADFSDALEEQNRVSNDFARSVNYTRRALTYEVIGQNKLARRDFESVDRLLNKSDTLKGLSEGREYLLRAFAAEKLSNNSIREECLKSAAEHSIGKDQFRELVFSSMPKADLKVLKLGSFKD